MLFRSEKNEEVDENTKEQMTTVDGSEPVVEESSEKVEEVKEQEKKTPVETPTEAPRRTRKRRTE